MADARTHDRADDAGPPRGGKGRYAPTLAARERARAAAELRSKGWTYQRIADHLGYASRTSAESAVKREFERIVAPGVEMLRKSQQEALDRMKAQAFEVMERQHLSVSNGHIVGAGCSPEHAAGHPGLAMADCYGPPVLDDGPKLDAIKTLVQVFTRESKLHGVDAQVKVEREESGTVRIEIVGVDTDKL